MQRKNVIKNKIRNRLEHTKLLCLAAALCAACFLCGCTRKEELLILTEQAAQQETAAETGEAKDADSGDASALIQEDAVISQSAEEMSANKARQELAESGLLYVHVCGAVKMPGVYELPAGSRVYEAIQAAGGFSENAEQNYVNQAQALSDGVKLVIPTVEEVAAVKDVGTTDEKLPDLSAAGEKKETAVQIGIIESDDAAEKETAKQADAGNGNQPGGKININTATKQELCTIPGVGETRAAAIISYRESHGGFAKPEDIMKVNGIKEGMYEKIKDNISVD